MQTIAWRDRWRQRGRPLTTSTFRLAFAGGMLFSLATLCVLIFIRWSVCSLLDQRVDASIEVEMTHLRETYRISGLSGLEDDLLAHPSSPQRIYLLVDKTGLRLTGDLERWPEEARSIEGHANGGRHWLTFDSTPATDDGDDGLSRGTVFELPGGERLLLARLQTERTAFEQVLDRTIIASGIVGLCLGGLIGWWMAGHALKRLDAINQVTTAALDGNMDARVALVGSGDEFDHLASDLNAMLDRIQRLITAMRGVTRNIAHDLRTPLTRLRSRLETALLAAVSSGAAPGRTTLEAAINDIDGVLATFSALLSIARIEALPARQGFGEVSLPGLIEDAVDLYAPLAEERGLTLVKGVVSDVPNVEGNAQLIFQALVNLVDNAVKYCETGGTIEVSVTLTDEGVRLMVADDGPGIPAQERQRVLQPFVRLDSSRAGMGLGLSLVVAVAEFHRAHLGLEDNWPGLKVLMTFRLPSPDAPGDDSMPARLIKSL